MAIQRNPWHSVRHMPKLCKYLHNRMHCKGLQHHRLHFVGSRGGLCCSSLKKKNHYHSPLCPGKASSWEFSNGYHFLFHD